MPVKAAPRERPIIVMLLSACDNGAWEHAQLDWVEEKTDGAVEVIATGADGKRLALEHTLIQPFVGEKFDSEVFIRAFGLIEKNPELIRPERNLDVIIPVQAIPKGYNWDEVGKDLLIWLLANHSAAPQEGQSSHVVPVAATSKNGPLALTITLRTMHLPRMAGSCLISRDKMPGDLEAIVEKALRTKIPKLVATAADKRILLLERDQISLGDNEIYRQIAKLAGSFPDLARIDEIWFANTSILASENWTYFTLLDGRGLVELLTFENGALKTRRDDRPNLGARTASFSGADAAKKESIRDHEAAPASRHRSYGHGGQPCADLFANSNARGGTTWRSRPSYPSMWVVTLTADGHRHKICQIVFGKDGAFYLTFPYFKHTKGLLAEATVDGPPGAETLIDLAKKGKVASHLVKYSHHSDGEVHFSQHGKIKTVVRRKSVPLAEQQGHIFTLIIQGLRAFEGVSAAKENAMSSKRTTLTFGITDRFPKAVRIVGRWYWIEDLPVDPRPPMVGPQIKAVDPDGIAHNAFIVGNPHDKKHVLVLTCIPQDSISPAHDLMMFMGGFDLSSKIRNSKNPTGFLTFLYPADDYDELKRRLGSVDYTPTAEVLQPKTESD
jgi:hypothetical protein